MRIVDHSIITNIRQQLLIRVSYVLVKLSDEFTNTAIAGYLDCSPGTVSALKRFNFHSGGRTPIRNMDRLLRICEKLKIDYKYSVWTVRGKPHYDFSSPSIIGWTNKANKLPIDKRVTKRGVKRNESHF